MNKTLLYVSCCVLALSCHSTRLAYHGGAISKSTTFNGDLQPVNTDSLAGQPYMTISDDNIEIDFNDATIEGRQEGRFPDAFEGIAIHIKDCKNVTIKNVNIHGFKIAILAENVENLTILSSNLSYNYRPKLHSRWDREALSDWLYFHHNENDEWKEYGAAIYLKGCTNALIKDVLCHQGMNGLLMVKCDGALVYNNDIRFNSGLGIGLYRSSHNRIMHNKLDWNARGYSHGKYARGQDSSAILLYEQSSHNTIAFNSGTHSGDGLFLWAGQYTMDTGLGGCDSNMIYRNDFSHSIANGIEVTFSSNFMIDNILNDCRYGIWGGYSHHSIIRGNEIIGCETGIAIEHGRYNVIEENGIDDCETGVNLWARANQPDDWPYAQKVDVTSRQYSLSNNHFSHMNTGLEVSLTDSVWMHDNTFNLVQHETSSPKGASLLLSGHTDQSWINMTAPVPEGFEDGQLSTLPLENPRGRKYIIVNEWGPYDYKSPLLALRRKEFMDGDELLFFDILGPKGKWRIDSIKGCAMSDHKVGNIPDSLIVTCGNGTGSRYIGLVFAGDGVITQFGDTIAAGTDFPFHYAESNVAVKWKVSFFAYDSLADPVLRPDAFNVLLNGKPIKTISNPKLTYRWWDAPDADIPADRFAIRATSSIVTPTGEYTLLVESDDGIRIWLDEELILNRWDIHTPTIDEVSFEASEGHHTLKVEYFEGGGLGVLDVSILDH